MMMRRNLALTGRAAGGLIGRPRGTGKGRVKQNNHEQADACGDGTAAVLRSLHVARDPYMSLGTITSSAIVCKPDRRRGSLTLTLYANRESLSRPRQSHALRVLAIPPNLT